MTRLAGLDSSPTEIAVAERTATAVATHRAEQGGRGNPHLLAAAALHGGAHQRLVTEESLEEDAD